MKKSSKKMIVQISVFGGILAVLLIVFLLIIKPNENKKKEFGKITFFDGIQKDSVDGIQISLFRNGMEFHTLINKISNEWYILSPFYVRADPFAIDKLLDDVLVIASERVLTNVNPEKLVEYGFESPTSAVYLGLHDGKTVSLVNGLISPIENYYYTLFNNDTNTVYITYAYKFSSVEKTPGELANKQIFDERLQPIPSITNFEITSQTGVLYSFAKVSNSGGVYWEMRSPQRMRVDDYALKRKQLELYAISANTYAAYDQAPETIRFFELNRPKYRIRIASDNGMVSETYIGSLSVSNFVFGYSTAKPGIFQIYESDLAETFNLAVSNFKPIEVQQ